MMTAMMNRNNCTAAVAQTASRSAMGYFSEPSSEASAMNIVLSLDAALLAASIIFILISRIIGIAYT